MALAPVDARVAGMDEPTRFWPVAEANGRGDQPTRSVAQVIHPLRVTLGGCAGTYGRSLTRRWEAAMATDGFTDHVGVDPNVADAGTGVVVALFRSLRSGAGCSRPLPQAEPCSERFDSARPAPAATGVDHNPPPKLRKDLHMPVSDQLSKLAARAKDLEDRAAAAQGKAKADLEHDVEMARESAQETADTLRESVAAGKGQVSSWWEGVQRSWNEHLDAVRHNVEDKKAAQDRKTAERIADQAEDDAAFAVDYAYAAIEEAEYAVLDATLARMDADDLANA
jgi:hypothetical protein